MTANLQSHLTNLRRSILAMGALVEVRVGRAIESLTSGDFPAAIDVRHGDREVDVMDLDIERECIEILALLQPVADDLRFVLTVLRVNSELERIADLAKGIAKRLLSLDRRGLHKAPSDLSDMASIVRDTLSRTLTAFSAGDAESARRIRISDDVIDRLHRSVLEWAQNEIASGGGDNAVATIDFMRIGRSLERIGDLCANIAEEIVFMVEGNVVRHSGDSGGTSAPVRQPPA